jgi:cytidylate kinase
MEQKIDRKKEKKQNVICICGMTGCGKSTLAKQLANKYELKYFSGGDTLKALANEIGYKQSGKDWWETKEGTRFLQQRIKENKFDKKVDEKLIKLAEQGNVVLDSWTMPWLLKEGFKVWLEASTEVRAKRITERDGINLEKGLAALKEKDEKTRIIYKKLYGFDLGKDFSPFNMILDTNELDADEVFQVLCTVIDRLYIKNLETQIQ